jgi:predicted acylesterase/phospholipase RssA
VHLAVESSKPPASSNIKLDIIAGTLIGGLNASIIAGSREEDHPEKALEQFWLELAEGSSNIIKSDTNLNSRFINGLKIILELKKEFEYS